MKYSIRVELFPPGAFGVPEGSRTVIPAGSQSQVGDTFHSKTLTRVAYGCLSRYREDKDAVTQTFTLDSVKCSLKDNFMVLEIEAGSHVDAYNVATKVLERFLQQLSLGMKQLFSFSPLHIEGEDERIYPLPRIVIMANVTMYNLDNVRTAIAHALAGFPVSDPVLDKALQYYEHSLFLFENRNRITDMTSRHFQFLIASSFLNLWKAITTIIGEPGEKNFQIRYRAIGLSYDYFSSKIDRVKKLRDDYDVAHYHSDPDRVAEIEKSYGEARQVAENVLTLYRDYLIKRPNKDT